jgi:hypothetical protein
MITRIITSLVQLALLGAVVPMVYAVYLDIKNGGLNDN